MLAEGHCIPHMRHADVYADLYMRFNFMSLKFLLCILKI
jgi:hypothetical protein